jgi:hypothetical protein
MEGTELSLLNIFEVEYEGELRHFVCFLDSALAGARGIAPESIVGEFTPGPDGAFDLGTFRVNPAFINAFIRYMNVETAYAPDLEREAEELRDDRLMLLDPRHASNLSAEPTVSEVIGCFDVDSHGKIVPESFQYNPEHLWIDPKTGVSAYLHDRAFYDNLHNITRIV